MIRETHSNNNDSFEPQSSILSFLQFDNPTLDQVKVLTHLQQFVCESNNDDFMVVSGSAGTGKSSIMNAVVKYLEINNKCVKIAAPTARAARLIAAKTANIATTLHSLIFNVSNDPEKAPVIFNPKIDSNDNFTIYIIDEASMINSKLVKNHENELFICNVPILQALKDFIKSGNPKNKVIFVGDRFQLAPIGEVDSNALYPKYLREYFFWKGIEFSLKEVKRQGHDSEILNTAIKLKDSISNDTTIPKILSKQNFNIYKSVNSYIKNLKIFGPNKVMAIAATHNQCKFFNKLVRDDRFGKSAKPILRNDVLIVKRNWKRCGQYLYNGETVIVKEANFEAIETVAGIQFLPATLRVKNSEGKEVEISEYIMLDCIQNGSGSLGYIKENNLYHERYKKNKTYRQSGNIEDDRYLGAIRLNYGYCITCNVAQGGEWDQIYLNTSYIPSTRWAYTAVTRAKQNLFIF